VPRASSRQILCRVETILCREHAALGTGCQSGSECRDRATFLVSARTSNGYNSLSSKLHNQKVVAGSFITSIDPLLLLVIFRCADRYDSQVLTDYTSGVWELIENVVLNQSGNYLVVIHAWSAIWW
jgi:hypothetical protein